MFNFKNIFNFKKFDRAKWVAWVMEKRVTFFFSIIIITIFIIFLGMYWGEKKPSKKVIQAKDPNKIIPPSLKEYYFFKNEIDIEQDIGLIVKPENQNSGFNNDQDLIKELLENKAINSDNNLLKEEISSLFSEKKQ